jgi:ribonuclease Z
MTTVVGSKHWLTAICCLLLVGACGGKDRGHAVGGTSGGQVNQGGTSGTVGVPGGVGGSTTASAGAGGFAAGTNSCGGDGQVGGNSGAMTVTLLGTGSPIPSADRYGNSTLVEVPGLRLVFDVGRGAPIRLWQKQIPLGSINAHFLTHLHSDHVNGLPDLWTSGWIQTPFGSRKTPFVIYGPPGTEAMMANLWEAFSEDRRIRLADELNPIEGIQIEAHDVGPGAVFCQAGVTVWTFDVDHGELVKPARGYKISYAGHTVVLSGDTRYSTNVENAATGADLLIHEVAMIPKALLDKYPAYKAILAHHISPEEAGSLFAVARPKLAVYSHIVLSGLPSEGIPFPTPADLLAATRTNYDGPIVVGSDQMAFKIDDSGVSMVSGTGGGGAGGGSAGGRSGAGGAPTGASGAGGATGGAGG